MQSPSSIFNFLLVALAVVSIEAAPHSDVQDSSEGWKPTPNAGNVGEDLTRSIGPEILHSQSEKPIEKADLTRFPSTTTKTRRMVYGWSPKGFDGDNDESSNHSDLSLMAADSPETSEHKSKVITKQSAPSGPTKPKAGPKAAPPAEVLKALCHSLLSGESGKSSDKSTGALSPAGKELAGKANSSTSWSPKSPALEKTPGMATDPKLSPNATGSTLSGDRQVPAGNGDKYSAAMSWCHQFMNYSSSDTGASHSSSSVGPKPSVHANGTALPPSSPVDPSASGSKNDSKLSPGKIEDSKSSDDQGVVEDKSGKEKNPKAPTNFKVPSNQVPSS
ncbi:hypothetical protein PGT21_024760 [Puccinia graminis f. sp. tritici]|uniref:Uncharacterized protein n=2 Tax=Puccinia graminis f. sp. tritici TaxID=56615 RepID=E3KX40_PUCGT|nr:uncharacterized protein PGTG_14149 [Puccinia graminis f. sp. tritici CRL 75-36-700-3]EFP88810.1 hypothetical protein PGTG_14149 [Puccinia graminis f. sp. tritici CRL 75-36-700-3]KAA1113198.1 hypothetical protein PGT21_024760 [Puccinia graminis f. sp. tritici]